MYLDDYQNYELYLSRFGPANNEEDKVTGVLPYTAPEIFQNQQRLTHMLFFGQSAFFEYRDDDQRLFTSKLIWDLRL